MPPRVSYHPPNKLAEYPRKVVDVTIKGLPLEHFMRSGLDSSYLAEFKAEPSDGRAPAIIYVPAGPQLRIEIPPGDPRRVVLQVQGFDEDVVTRFNSLAPPSILLRTVAFDNTTLIGLTHLFVGHEAVVNARYVRVPIEEFWAMGLPAEYVKYAVRERGEEQIGQLERRLRSLRNG